MFDFGAGELLVIGIVALVVIGPKELPGVLRQVGKATGKMRQMAGEFRAQFDEAMREAELQEATKHLTGFKDDVISTATQLNPIADISHEIHSSTAMLSTPYTPTETTAPAGITEPSPPVMAEKPKPTRKRPSKTADIADVAASSSVPAPALKAMPADMAGSPRAATAQKTARKKGATVVALGPVEQAASTKPAASAKTAVSAKTATKPAAAAAKRAPAKLALVDTPPKQTQKAAARTAAPAEKRSGGKVVALKTPPKAG